MDDHSATIEWLSPAVGLLRVHPGPGGELGDPYVWCCTLVRSGDTATIKGVDLAPTRSVGRAVKRCLASAGMTRRTYERISGPSRSVENRQ